MDLRFEHQKLWWIAIQLDWGETAEVPLETPGVCRSWFGPENPSVFQWFSMVFHGFPWFSTSMWVYMVVSWCFPSFSTCFPHDFANDFWCRARRPTMYKPNQHPECGRNVFTWSPFVSNRKHDDCDDVWWFWITLADWKNPIWQLKSYIPNMLMICNFGSGWIQVDNLGFIYLVGGSHV